MKVKMKLGDRGVLPRVIFERKLLFKFRLYEDMRIFSALHGKGLLDHYIDVKPNALRSGTSSISKGSQYDDVVNKYFSWRICRRLNANHLPLYQ